MKVTDPTGRAWRVSRRWVPWRRRLKGWIPEAPTLGVLDVPVVGVVLVVLVGIPLLLVMTVAVLELVVLLVVFPFALLVRVAFGRHWTVEARKGWRPWWEERSGGWRESGSRIHDVAAAIERGVLPEQTIDRPAAPRTPETP